MKAVEKNDIALLDYWTVLFVVLFFSYLVVGWVFRKSDWPYLYHNIEMWVYERYMPMFITLDNNYLESVGT